MEPLGDARAYVERGKARQQQGDLDGAIADYDEALKLNPHETEAQALRGLARFEKGDTAGAFADHAAALQLDPQQANAALPSDLFAPAPAGTSADEPRDAQGYLSRARRRKDQGDYAGAVIDCTQALKLEPQSADAYLVRAIARQGQGYLDRAVADCDRALQVKPDEVRAYLLRGAVRGAQDQLDLARQDYDKALEIDPQNAEALTRRAQVRAAQGDTEGALADCDRALAADPGNADAYQTRGAARWERGDLDGALADCDQAVRLAPDDARTYLLRGNVRQAHEDEDGAWADFQHAARLDPVLAESLREQGYEPSPSPSGALTTPSQAEELDTAAPEEEPAARRMPAAGPRSWVVPAALHGALAGAFYGWISPAVAAAFGLFLFAPLFLVLFFGRRLGYRRAVFLGVAVAAVAVVLYLAVDHGIAGRFLDVTDGSAAGIIGWLLAWGAFGALLMVVAGSSNLTLLAGSIRGGLVPALTWARGGAGVGLFLGAMLGALFWVDLPGGLIGGLAGAVSGFLLGGDTGRNPRVIVLAVFGAGLGAAVGEVDPAAVYQVIRAGLAGGLYWTIAGALVGASDGGTVGSRSGERVAGGPLYTRLFGDTPLPQGQGFNLATALLGAVAGLFTGANIGLVAGSILGGLAVADQVIGPVVVAGAVEGVIAWVVGGAVLGAVCAGIFGSRIVSAEGVLAGPAYAPANAPLRGVPLLLAGLGGAGVGAGLALMAWLLGRELGGIIYWACAGAGLGSLIGAKLWSILEK